MRPGFAINGRVAHLGLGRNIDARIRFYAVFRVRSDMRARFAIDRRVADLGLRLHICASVGLHSGLVVRRDVRARLAIHGRVADLAFGRGIGSGFAAYAIWTRVCVSMQLGVDVYPADLLLDVGVGRRIHTLLADTQVWRHDPSLAWCAKRDVYCLALGHFGRRADQVAKRRVGLGIFASLGSFSGTLGSFGSALASGSGGTSSTGGASSGTGGTSGPTRSSLGGSPSCLTRSSSATLGSSSRSSSASSLGTRQTTTTTTGPHQSQPFVSDLDRLQRDLVLGGVKLGPVPLADPALGKLPAVDLLVAGAHLDDGAVKAPNGGQIVGRVTSTLVPHL